ncbi:MAG: adenylate/guanylate cyclase domain-containing protein [Armatimonadota bacterium]
MKCPSCGASQPDGELVCQECNNYLNLSEAELDRVERFRLSTHTELLCVMFCDISGFTRLADQSQSHSQKVLAVHAAIVQAISEEDRAGEVVNTAGDGLLVVFANPAVAAECALRMHEATHQFYSGTLTNDHIIHALQKAGQKPHAGLHDVPHRIHIGLHLGIVTRGGRTSRDVFGHNVNICCRLCDLAGPGQTYMSVPVYDNARLIMGERAGLEWKTWKDLPIRGISAPMTVMGVVQQPLHQILPPRGVKLPAHPLFDFRVPAVTAAGISAVLVIGLIVSLTAMRPKPQPMPAPVTPVVRKTEEVLPPLVAMVADTPETPIQQTMTPTAASATNYATGSATNSVSLQPSASSAVSTATLPVPKTAPDSTQPNEPGSAANAIDDQDISRVFPQLLKAGSPNRLSSGETDLWGTLAAMKGKEGLLVAAGVDEHAKPEALMSLVLDGNFDGKLNSEGAPPLFDIMVSVNGPGAPAREVHAYPLKDGKLGKEITLPVGCLARALTHGTRTVWIFRVPYKELGVSGGMSVNFKVIYQPDGTAGADVYVHPPSADGTRLRQIIIP